MGRSHLLVTLRSKSVLGAHDLGRKLPNDPYCAGRTLLEGDLRKQAANPSTLNSLLLGPYDPDIVAPWDVVGCR